MEKAIITTNYNTTQYKSFHYLEDGTISFSILATKYSKPVLDSNIYDVKVIDTGNSYEAHLSISNNKETFNQELSFYFEDKIEKIYNSFFNPMVKEKIKKIGYHHKLGLLLYGKQGTGKTSMLKKYFTSIIKDHQGLVFNVTSFAHFSVLWDFIKNIRQIQDNPIVVFMDEFEELVGDEGYGFESLTKKIMDGFESIDNCFFMMATNYIDQIPETIKNRPSRIKYCIEVEGITNIDIITKFLKDSFEKVEMEVDFEKDIKNMIGNTIDELKQYVLDKIMDIENEEPIQKSQIGFKTKKK
jgi:SpoVK/Ycf46/Vps4 family AAA+-type ATPase